MDDAVGSQGYRLSVCHGPPMAERTRTVGGRNGAIALQVSCSHQQRHDERDSRVGYFDAWHGAGGTAWRCMATQRFPERLSRERSGAGPGRAGSGWMLVLCWVGSAGHPGKSGRAASMAAAGTPSPPFSSDRFVHSFTHPSPAACRAQVGGVVAACGLRSQPAGAASPSPSARDATRHAAGSCLVRLPYPSG